MLYKLLFIGVLLTGCSQSDEHMTSKEDMVTLLGTDANNNGVRDDVEAYINKRFQGFYNAEKDWAIAMQYAKATQILIQEPEKAYESKTYIMMEDAHDCQAYVFDQEGGNSWESWLEYSQAHKVYDAEFKDIIFNTRERLEAYMQYNDSLSGHVYDSRPAVKEKCEVDIDAL